MDDKQRVILALKVIAAKAQQLAHDLENGGLWEHDLERGVAEISEQLRYVHD